MLKLYGAVDAVSLNLNLFLSMLFPDSFYVFEINPGQMRPEDVIFHPDFSQLRIKGLSLIIFSKVLFF